MPSKYPLVSIIIPVYNAAPYLSECLESISRQSYQNIEIICINDGSTDDSSSILRRYSERIPRLSIYDQHNMGVSSARNTGLNYANGHYILFVDADDTIDSDYVETYLSAADPEAVTIVAGGFLGDKSYSGAAIRDEFLYQGLRTEAINQPWAKLYHAETILKNNIRFDESVSIGEDLLFNLEYLNCVEIAHTVSDTRYHNRKTPGSLTRSYRESKYRELTYVDSKSRQLLSPVDLQLASILNYIRIKNLISCVGTSSSNDSHYTNAQVREIAKLWQSTDPPLRIYSGDALMRLIGWSYRHIGLYHTSTLVRVASSLRKITR